MLIVDDSAVIRQALQKIIAPDPEMEVMATASDPYIAADKMRREIPDVIVLDVEMPRMDGITFLGKIMTQRPIPVIICSAFTETGSALAFKALEYGAVDIIAKPRVGARQFLEESRVRICDAIRAAAAARVKRAALHSLPAVPKLTADVVLERVASPPGLKTADKVVVVGASTGGTEALSSFLQAMPADAPGIVIVQHMPEHFTGAFAARLDNICRVAVKEAENDDAVLKGRALIAPGNLHILLKRAGGRYFVEVKDGPLVSRHRPSVDVLFRSAAQNAGGNAVGVIMTGMGDDGARGMLELKEAGACTIAQDEETCVVFGMPKKAIELHAVDRVLPLDAIPAAVLREAND
ncbi:MAG TPA: chemotaxis response regulator protein-glutamate methylesterase [Desulfuromonadaceae bacterium]